jgi:heme A synthase
MREVVWIRRLAFIGAVLCFGVVVLGGYAPVELGSWIPDWPGCFGHIAPTGSAEHYASDADVRKAWVEMIRYFAARWASSSW